MIWETFAMAYVFRSLPSEPSAQRKVLALLTLTPQESHMNIPSSMGKSLLCAAACAVALASAQTANAQVTLSLSGTASGATVYLYPHLSCLYGSAAATLYVGTSESEIYTYAGYAFWQGTGSENEGEVSWTAPTAGTYYFQATLSSDSTDPEACGWQSPSSNAKSNIITLSPSIQAFPARPSGSRANSLLDSDFELTQPSAPGAPIHGGMVSGPAHR